MRKYGDFSFIWLNSAKYFCGILILNSGSINIPRNIGKPYQMSAAPTIVVNPNDRITLLDFAENISNILKISEVVMAKKTLPEKIRRRENLVNGKRKPSRKSAKLS